MNKRVLAAILLSLGLAVFFQSCDSQIKFGGNSKLTQSEGDFYTGKPGIYTQTDPQAQCTQVSRNGTPFPNRIIQYDSIARMARLVRDNCNDIEPQPIAESEYSLSSDQLTLLYQGGSFAFQADATEFNLINPICPTGLTAIAQTPINLFTSPLHLVAPAWQPYTGVEAFLFGSIEALPRYTIRRTTAGPFDHYRRVSQYLTLDRGVAHAISFLVERGNTPSASIAVWEGGDEAVVYLDFASGVAQITYSNGFTALSVAAQPYGTGYNLTLFLTTAAAPRGPMEIGVAPNRSPIGPELGQAGDFVYATAAALHRVTDFCQ